MFDARDVKITLGGAEHGGAPDVSYVLAPSTPRGAPPDPPGSYDFNVTMKIGPHELAELACRALTTPSLDAQAALDVLVDALLERGIVREPERDIATNSVLVQAWAWAGEHAVGRWERFVILLDAAIAAAAETIVGQGAP